MDIRDLRIGNWVMYNDQNQTPMPTAIQIGIQDLVLINENVKDCNYQPILLTEEILLKCGFEKINHIHGYSFYSLSKSKKNKCHIDIYDNKTLWMGYSVGHCQHLHELQNLFYSLTKTELIINL